MKKKKSSLIIASAFFALSQSSCSLHSIYRFALEAPSVKAEGQTVSWKKVENAEVYKVFKAEDDSPLGSTKRLLFTIDGLMVEDLDVYVKACYENDDFRFNDSEKSDTVTLSCPKLDAPRLEVNQNTITWQAVPRADYYKIFNYSTRKVIEQTNSTSYTFTNIDSDLTVYAVAYYSDARLEGKHSSFSNVVAIKPDILTVDVSTATSDTNYTIGQHVKEITFTGTSTFNWSIEAPASEGTLTVRFKDLNINGGTEPCFFADSEDLEVNLIIEGENRVSSERADAISAGTLKITGNSSPVLYASGGDGSDGVDGSSGFVTDMDGFNGGGAGSGLSGSAGISAAHLSIAGITLVAHGGDGGDGGRGGDGADGQTNSAEIFDRHEYGIFGAEIQSISHYGKAFKGGNGGRGGNGGNGGLPISYQDLYFDNSSSLDLYYGNGGNGGRGGNGGNGGNGRNYHGSTTGISYLICVDPGEGGDGGDGGRGGDGGLSVYSPLSLSGDNVSLTPGTNGIGASGGLRGSGGRGGSGGETHATANDHSAPNAPNGADGSNGSSGQSY